MTITNENSQDNNTPRTRNRVADKTLPFTGSKEGLSLRQYLESEFRALGFKSHKFSHKKEPETRLADSLWLSWVDYSKGLPRNAATTKIEVRVVFIEHKHPRYSDWDEHEIIYTVTHHARTRGGCYPHKMGTVTFKEKHYYTADVLAYVKYLIAKEM